MTVTQIFRKVSITGNGWSQSIDSLFDVLILDEGSKVWLKNDDFFRSHSLKIISSGKKNIDP